MWTTRSRWYAADPLEPYLIGSWTEQNQLRGLIKINEVIFGERNVIKETHLLKIGLNSVQQIDA